MTSNADVPTPTRPDVVTLLAYAPPVAIVAGLWLTYRLAPSAYLEHVLDPVRREGQAVEIITFAAAAAAGVLLGASAWRWRRQTAPGASAAPWRLRLVVAAAALFFAGEEVSWGQTWFGWRTPEALTAHTPETNLHNVDTLPVRVQSLGSLFLIAVFFVLPAAVRLRLAPRAWEPAAPGGPAVWCMAVAFAWKELKQLYRTVIEPDWETSVVYLEFVEQVPEHKELLVAVALLTYACAGRRGGRCAGGSGR